MELATWCYPNGRKAKILEWPPHSPDLNPIEMVWAIMKQIMGHYKNQSRELFVTHVQESWDEIPNITIKKLTASMPERINKCIAANGAWFGK